MNTGPNLPTSFVKTITVNNQPLVLHFVNLKSEVPAFQVRCINDKKAPLLQYTLQPDGWQLGETIPEPYAFLGQHIPALIAEATGVVTV